MKFFKSSNIFILILSVFISSCGNIIYLDDPSNILNNNNGSNNSGSKGANDITSFVINGVAGNIDETTTPPNILVVMPYGTDLSNLSPIIGITGVSVNPASGVSQDFTNSTVTPVKYTVTAADSSTKAYDVTVRLFNPFTITIQTDNPGVTNNDQFRLPMYGTGYNFTIDWGDTQTETYVENTNPSDHTLTHTYALTGTYVIKIYGDFPRIYFNYLINSDRTKLTQINQWGDIAWTSFQRAFAGCTNVTMPATDAPDLSNVTDTSEMFLRAQVFNGNISAWDVSNVTNMYGMFNQASVFNQDLSSWDVSSVTNMREMFYGSGFNQNISTWNVSNVTNMRSMFYSTPFNQDISSWNVSSVTDMSSMFQSNTVFNQDISSWDVSSVTDMGYMFYNASAFNQDISSWDVSAVKSMSNMFNRATAFNQNISSWNVSNVTTMRYMFANADTFDQPIGVWDVSSVTDMEGMFEYIDAFDQSINAWNVSNVTNMRQMFRGAKTFNQALNSWNVSSVTNMGSMFYKNSAFNQNISTWNVSSVTDMSSMFFQATSFDQDLSAWDISNVQNMSYMFGLVTLSTTNYSNMLSAWSGLSVQSGVSLNAGHSKYNNTGQTGRNILTGAPNNWTISDGGHI